MDVAQLWQGGVKDEGGVLDQAPCLPRTCRRGSWAPAGRPGCRRAPHQLGRQPRGSGRRGRCGPRPCRGRSSGAPRRRRRGPGVRGFRRSEEAGPRVATILVWRDMVVSLFLYVDALFGRWARRVLREWRSRARSCLRGTPGRRRRRWRCSPRRRAMWNLAIAARVSPPPAIEKASEWAMAEAIILVPPANCGSSNTPTGPFQTMVPALAMISESLAAVFGPTSRMRSLAPPRHRRCGWHGPARRLRRRRRRRPAAAPRRRVPSSCP
jgi:hypothetical protein